MDSLKIVLLADTHFGYSMGTAQAKRIVKKINTENPDVVCIAGDIFDNEYDAISKPDKLKEILKGIKSKYGVYACWGNHDLNEPILAGFTFNGTEDNYNDPRMEEFLTDAGIHLLDDEAVLIAQQILYCQGRRDASRCEKVEGSSATRPSLPNRWSQENQLFSLTISKRIRRDSCCRC